MLTQTIFYVFSAILVGSAVLVITVRNPVHAALFLVLAFFSSAAIWLLLEAEFLAIALVLVYVGAVMVLFLFVVMMLDINMAPLREGFVRYLPLSVLVALLMIIAMGLVIGSGAFNLGDWKPVADTGSNTLALGKALFSEFLYPFEIAGAILMVAIVAAIALTLRGPRSTKTQAPEKQVLVKAKDRIRIVKMDAEKP